MERKAAFSAAACAPKAQAAAEVMTNEAEARAVKGGVYLYEYGFTFLGRRHTRNHWHIACSPRHSTFWRRPLTARRPSRRPQRERPAGSTHLKRSQSQTLQDRMSWETLGPEPGPTWSTWQRTWSTWQRRRARSAGRSHTIMRGRCSMRDIGERKRSMRMSASSRAPYRATVTSEQLRTTLSAITFPSQRAERSAVREASKPQ